MRILYVNKASPFTIGGAELRLWEIARRLASRGHKVQIVCGRNLPELPNRQRADGIYIHNVTVLPSWLFRFRKLSFFLAQVAKEILGYKVNVLVVVDGATDATEAVAIEPEFPHCNPRRQPGTG